MQSRGTVKRNYNAKYRQDHSERELKENMVRSRGNITQKVRKRKL